MNREEMGLDCLNYCVMPLLENSSFNKTEMPDFFTIIETLILFKDQALMNKVKDSILQTNDQDTLKSLLDKIEPTFDKFKLSQAILDLFEARLMWLRAFLKTTPRQSRKMVNARLSDHPEVEYFLKGDRYSISYTTTLPVTFAQKYGGLQSTLG